MMILDPPCELAAPSDAYRNYCLWPYNPIAPTANSWRPVNLLFRSFQIAGAHQNLYSIVHALRRDIGPDKTVWGVKWNGGKIGWEYYFYDYERRERRVSLSEVLRNLAPWMQTRLTINESLPYFMFSLDIDEAVATGSRPLEAAHIYIGNPGGLLSSGISYELTEDHFKLENLYSFFDAGKQLDEAVEKIFCSVHVDTASIDVDEILWPELRECDSICVANKPTHDTVYFSGVNTDQLLIFLNRLNYPSDLVSYVNNHRSRFLPLLHDVGFDYVQKKSTIRILKSGFYGVF